MSYIFIKKKSGKFDLLKKDNREFLGTFDSKDEAKKWLKQKIGGKRLSLRGRQAVKNLAENGGNMRKALKDAGFSDTIADTPGRFFNSKAAISEYVNILNKAGLTDNFLAKTHKDLANASVLKDFEFPNRQKKIVLDVKDEDGNDKKVVETEYTPVPDEEIKKIIESMPGCKLAQIIDHYTKKIAYYTAPVHGARNEALKTAYKNKGHFAPEHISLDTHHDLTPEEQEELDKIFKTNEST